MSTPNSRLSIAELMKLKFDEVQSIMMEREKKMEMEMGSLVKFQHVLKKEINTLESSKSIEKCSLEEKLQRSEMRCEELEKRFILKQEENEKLLAQKWDAEEKLEKSVRECEELRSEKFYAYERMEEKLEKLSREKLDVEEKLEKLSREKLDVDMKIVEKEVKIENLSDEVWEVEEKLKIKGRECEELKRTVQELQVKKAQSDEDARVYKARVHNLEAKAKSVMNMEIEMGKVVKERDSLNKKIVEKEEKISEVEGKLEWKGRECEELKRKEIEVEGVVQELRVSKMESDKDAQLYKSRVHDLEVKMSKVKANLAGLVGSMNDTNFTDHFVENSEVVILDPPQGLSNKAGASSKAPIARVNGGDSRGIRLSKKVAIRGNGRDINHCCKLDIINKIKKKLGKENLEMFEQSCFGHLLKMNHLKYQGQLVKMLLLHLDKCVSNKERLVFIINNTNIEFRNDDFCRITGLHSGPSGATTARYSSIHKDVFRGRPSIKTKDVEEAFFKVSRDSEGRGESTLKLALLYFLYGTFIARNRSFKNIDLQYLHLVDDLDKFNAFPWGRVAYEYLVSSILWVRERIYDLEVSDKRTFTEVHGFIFALQIWAYEVMPSVATYCASRADNFENLRPHILRWTPKMKRIHFNHLKEFFAWGDQTHLVEKGESRMKGLERCSSSGAEEDEIFISDSDDEIPDTRPRKRIRSIKSEETDDDNDDDDDDDEFNMGLQRCSSFAAEDVIFICDSDDEIPDSPAKRNVPIQWNRKRKRSTYGCIKSEETAAAAAQELNTVNDEDFSGLQS